ncbi:MAG: hypothetical protein U5J96_07100 [Ignavibacteriaceae bacterium]|nr:hypothetical protein [Ignavibacteriaceae bacterium]
MMQKYSEWLNNTYKKFTSKNPERKKEFTTASFSPVKELYTPDDIKGTHEDRLGFPVNILLQEEFSQQCTEADTGRCGNMLVLVMPKNQMKDIDIYLSKVNQDYL